MRHQLVLCLGIGMCLSASPAEAKKMKGTDSSAATEARVLVKADAETLKGHVLRLSEGFVPRDVDHPANLDQAASYIRKAFESAGGRVTEQSFHVSEWNVHNKQIQKGPFRNVVASFGPETGERLIIGAHYDACGPHPAADDNASGVAGLLELARLLQKNPPPIRADLVAWSLEEPPYFGTRQMGSAVHADQLAKDGVKVRAAISLEMIGYFTDAPKSQRYPLPGLGLFYPSRGNFIVVAGRWSDSVLAKPLVQAMRGASKLPVRRFSGPSWTPSLDWSDHRNYWAHGWPAVMVTDTSYLRNANYHQASDKSDTLDYNRMAQVVDGVLAYIRIHK